MTVHSPLDAWSALVQGALLGTARTGARRPQAPADVARLLDAIDARGEATGDALPERRLLAHAAVLSTCVRAGRLPGRVTVHDDAAAPVDADDLPVVPPAAARLLTTILVGERRDALPEWLALAAAGGWRAPSALLPPLLDLARAHEPLRAAVAGVLGARGRWLVARNAEWAWAGATANATASATARDAWETGTPAERAAALATLRAEDAAAARALLVATWRAESAATRATLLAALHGALGPDDEPLLEQALDDRGRDVRAAARELLASLPGSALVARMTARARAALRLAPGGLTRRARLVVTLPAAPDTEAVRDGVHPTPPPGTGERAWWLAQIVAAVPPSAWSAEWGESAERIVELAREGEWGPTLADGWARAALRHRDAAWIEALLRANVLVDRHARLAPARAALVAALPAERREALLGDALAGRLLVDVEELLPGAAHAWSAPFARRVLAWLRARAAASGPPEALGTPPWALLQQLPTIALRLPPALADEAEDGWPDEPTPPWGPAIERFLALLTFRRALAAAFTPSDPA